MTKIISIMNQKGGVGKTTTTLNLGAGLCSLGKKVLLVDLDPQASLTCAMGIKQDEQETNIFHFLKGNAGFDKVVLDDKDLHLIPSSIVLSGAELELSSVPGRELLLKEALDRLGNQYDCILLDCPPTLGLLTLNALTASSRVLIPIQAHYLPLDGVRYLLETLEIVRKRLNPHLEISGVVITMFDSRQKLQEEVAGIIRNHFDNKNFKTVIRSNVSLAEAPSFGEDIFTYKPASSGAHDYLNLCKELIEREEL